MKNGLILILILAITFGIIFLTSKYCYAITQPTSYSTAPHNTQTIDTLYTYTMNGTYTLYSNRYFELRQVSTGVIKQSVLEPALVGENEGRYYIRDYPMSGKWTTSGSATIYSLEASSFDSLMSTSAQILYFVMAIIFAILLWAVCLCFLILWLF